jgi:putative aldouronate transport system substrate-binding protein
MTAQSSSIAFYGSKFVVFLTSLSGLANGFFWSRTASVDQGSLPLGMVLPFTSDGKGQPIHYLSNGLGGVPFVNVLKKAGDDRIKELLAVSNFLAAPFGTQEYNLRTYGVKDVDYTLDDNGNPVLTTTGMAETNGNAWNMGSPLVLFSPSAPDAARSAQSWLQKLLPFAVQSPVFGLYSPTNATKGAALAQKIRDGEDAILYGRENIATWDQVVADWRANGGDQIRREFEDALQSVTP